MDKKRQQQPYILQHRISANMLLQGRITASGSPPTQIQSSRNQSSRVGPGWNGIGGQGTMRVSQSQLISVINEMREKAISQQLSQRQQQQQSQLLNSPPLQQPLPISVQFNKTVRTGGKLFKSRRSFTPQVVAVGEAREDDDSPMMIVSQPIEPKAQTRGHGFGVTQTTSKFVPIDQEIFKRGGNIINQISLTQRGEVLKQPLQRRTPLISTDRFKVKKFNAAKLYKALQSYYVEQLDGWEASLNNNVDLGLSSNQDMKSLTSGAGVGVVPPPRILSKNNSVQGGLGLAYLSRNNSTAALHLASVLNKSGNSNSTLDHLNLSQEEEEEDKEEKQEPLSKRLPPMSAAATTRERVLPLPTIQISSQVQDSFDDKASADAKKDEGIQCERSSRSPSTIAGYHIQRDDEIKSKTVQSPRLQTRPKSNRYLLQLQKDQSQPKLPDFFINDKSFEMLQLNVKGVNYQLLDPHQTKKKTLKQKLISQSPPVPRKMTLLSKSKKKDHGGTIKADMPLSNQLSAALTGGMLKSTFVKTERNNARQMAAFNNNKEPIKSWQIVEDLSANGGLSRPKSSGGIANPTSEDNQSAKLDLSTDNAAPAGIKVKELLQMKQPTSNSQGSNRKYMYRRDGLMILNTAPNKMQIY